MKRRDLIIIIFSVFTNCSFAQYELVSTLSESALGYTKGYHDFGDYVLIDHSSLGIISFHPESATVIETEIFSDYSTESLFNSTGMFRLKFLETGNQQNGHICFVGANGDVFMSVPIFYNTQFGINQTINIPSVILENKYYVVGENNGVHSIWESDGTDDGTNIILQTQDEIVGLFEHNDTLVYVERTSTSYNFFKQGVELDFQLFKQFPIETFMNFSGKIGTDGSSVYLNMQISQNYRQIWKTNLTSEGTMIFLDSISAAKILFNDDSFIFSYLNVQNNLGPFYKGLINEPLNLTRVPLVNSGVQESSIIYSFLGDNYYSYLSLEEGLEVVRLNDQLEFEVIGTLAPGPASAIPIEGNGPYLPTFTNFPSCVYGEDELFVVLRNKLNDETFIYKVNGSELAPVFKWRENDLNTQAIFKYGNWLYFLRGTNASIILERRSLNDTDTPLNKTSTGEDVWYKEITLIKNNNAFSGLQQDFQIRECLMDAQENVYLGFDSRCNSNYQIVMTDTAMVDDINGKFILAKLDKYGKCIWANSIADFGSFSLYRPFVCGLQSNGDLIVAGIFFGDGFFDDIFIPDEERNVFICSLSGEDGHLKWFRTLFLADNSNEKPDALFINEVDEVILTFAYDNYEIYFQNKLLTSDRSPVNAIAKFTPSGDLLWCNTTPTPWTDNFGKTVYIGNNEVSDGIISIQSQGDYNWSSSCEYSDWRSHIQELSNSTVVSSKPINQCNDLAGLTCAVDIGNNRIFAAGFFRGDSLQLGSFIASSLMGSFCHKNGFYCMIYDYRYDLVVTASIAVDSAFYPLDIARVNDLVYIYGAKGNNELCVVKFDTNGQYMGDKSLNQYADALDGQFQQCFSANEEHIVIVGQDFLRDTTLGVIPELNYMNCVSVLKLKNENWKYSDEWFEPLQLQSQNDEVVTVIYPNPFTNEIFIESNIAYQYYDIYDVNGRLVLQNYFQNSPLTKVNLGEVSNGVYILKLTGVSSTKTYKLIKSTQ